MRRASSSDPYAGAHASGGGAASAAPAPPRRADFVPRFGRAKPRDPRLDEIDPAELERRRRFVSERTGDPKKRPLG